MPSASDVTLTAIQPRFLYDTAIFDGATVTASSEVTSLPGTNLQNEIVRRPWRTANADDTKYVTYDLGTTTAINCLGIFGFNLNSVALLTIQAEDATATDEPTFASPDLEVGLTIPLNSDGTVFEKAITFFEQGTESYRYWRVAMHGDTSQSYWELGRLVAGQYFEPSVPPDLRATRTEKDPSIITRTDGQQTYSRARQLFRQYIIESRNYAQGDRDDWLALFMDRGQRLPMMCAFDPTHAHRFNRDTIYGRMTNSLNESLVQMEYGTIDMTFQEQW
jgi:hypothetical protein